ncbi:hypothetical protein FRC02_009189 [Tulasnella sp. 418]|nr:hypothetical protein FRC02_009189 [Tulasnella sp. 418]
MLAGTDYSSTVPVVFSRSKEKITQLLNSLYSECIQDNRPAPDIEAELRMQIVEALHQDILHRCRELQKLKNAYMPINRLPVELLVQIFFLAIHQVFPAKERLRTIINLGLVSARWHQIVHNTGSLWSVLDLSLGIKISQALIRKSGSAPLTVMAASGNMDKDMEGMICAEMYRTRRLVLCDPRMTTTKRNALFEQSAPLLEELTVKGSHWLMKKITQCQLVEELLEGHVPRLRRLVIEGTTIPPRVLPRSPLTHLTAVIRHKDIGNPRFAKKMSSYTNLEELRLTGYGPTESANQPMPELSLILPHLRYLQLQRVGGRETLFLLSAIKKFKNVSIHIDWMHIPRFTSLLPTFTPFPIFDSALGHSVAKSLRELAIIEPFKHDDSGKAEVRGCETAGIRIPDLFLTMRPWLLTDVAAQSRESAPGGDGCRLAAINGFIGAAQNTGL